MYQRFFLFVCFCRLNYRMSEHWKTAFLNMRWSKLETGGEIRIQLPSGLRLLFLCLQTCGSNLYLSFTFWSFSSIFQSFRFFFILYLYAVRATFCSCSCWSFPANFRSIRSSIVPLPIILELTCFKRMITVHQHPEDHRTFQTLPLLRR